MSQGLALGLVMNDVWPLPRDSKMSVEFAFEHAWRAWPHRHKFDTIQLGLRARVDTVLQMTHASKLKRVPYLYWDKDAHEDVICTREGIDPDEVDVEGVALWIDESIPAAGWRDLAVAFLAELEAS